MIQRHLLEQLNKVARRHRTLRMWQTLSAVWLLTALAAGLVWMWQVRTGTPLDAALPVLGVSGGILAVLAMWSSARLARNPTWVAHRIESAFPDLETRLLAAIEQSPRTPDGTLGFLQASVIRDALEHAQEHNWPSLISGRRLTLAVLANLVAFTLFGATLIGASRVQARASSVTEPKRAQSAVGTQLTVTIEPGSVEVERGSSLLVLARIQGPMPADATLVYQSHPNSGPTPSPVSLPMPSSLNDPVFGVRIPMVEDPLEYHVQLPGRTTPTYKVTVFEFPRLERADVRLAYPSYTGLEEKLIEDIRTVSVVEGTKVTLLCRLNKPVVSAMLTAVQGTVAADFKLAADVAEPRMYQTTLVAEKSLRLQLDLVDDAGRKNNKPIQFSINVLPNNPPSLKPVFPARDLEVSALEEMDVKAQVTDDYGVARMGLSFELAGKPPVEVVVLEKGTARQKHDVAHQIRLETLKAEPDQLLSYHWWVEDFDAKGQIRRTESDMYFAEVRPFEEIFRQGEQPPGGSQQQRQQQNQQGQGQNERQAQELAKLQKDIINAIWKLIRRETGEKLTDAFAPDIEQVRTSQQTAGQQATALAEKVEDEQSQAHVAAVLQQMGAATAALEAAEKGPAKEPLRPALAAAQSAYQSLLKLRAREHEVVRQQQQQQQSQQSQSSARSQQQREQMQQLDLREEENRYETQRQAQEQQQESAEERENRQVLNRLRELARRQHDLNERLKEMQASLEAAKTEQQKEEIRRQLQRLQDEQRQILQDTDELQSRLDQPENQEKNAEQQQQLAETRDQVRRASESLQQEKVSQAAAAGTRAEQQFDELREEFRRRAAGQFSEEMKQMRDAARELEQKEKALAEQIEQAAKPEEGPPSLQSKDPRDGVLEELGEQRKRLATLEEQMRTTIERAEATEPILTERLYDTARNLRDQSIQRSLQSTERSVRQGLLDDAKQQEAPASAGIQKLRENIERAAEGVLGDETEALRRAREELQNLSQELNDELERNAPNPEGQPQGQQPGQQRGQQPGQQSGARAGQRQPEEQQPGQAQPGQVGQQPRESEPQPGENREGEPGQAGQRQAQQPGQQRGSQPGQRGQEEQRPQDGGQQPGEIPEGEPGQEPGEQPQPGEQPSEQPGQQPGRGQRGQGQQGSTQRGQGQPGQPGMGEGQQPGENPEGEPGQQPQPGEQPGQQPGQAEGQPRRGQQRGQRGPRSAELGGGLSGPNDDQETGVDMTRRNSNPLTGDNFREWSDRLRDVEEMVSDPELRADAARIRERAKNLRAELKRHAAVPTWNLVRSQLAGPLAELENRVGEELLRRTSKKALVPLDRDPVPPQYSEKSRRYYEQLGSGK